MSKNLEIEFKTELSAYEYQKLEESNPFETGYYQENYYFDTPDLKLQKTFKTLRIRKKSGEYELTLKTPNPSGGQDEYNIPMDENDFNSFLNKGFIPGAFGIHEKVRLMTFSKTFRRDLKKELSLYSLDKTEFPDKTIDYELEMEYPDLINGEKVFNEFLKANNLSYKPLLGKSARAFLKLKN